MKKEKEKHAKQKQDGRLNDSVWELQEKTDRLLEKRFDIRISRTILYTHTVIFSLLNFVACLRCLIVALMRCRGSVTSVMRCRGSVMRCRGSVTSVMCCCGSVTSVMLCCGSVTSVMRCRGSVTSVMRCRCSVTSVMRCRCSVTSVESAAAAVSTDGLGSSQSTLTPSVQEIPYRPGFTRKQLGNAWLHQDAAR